MAVTVVGTPTSGGDFSVASITFSNTASGNGLFVGVVATDAGSNTYTATFNGDGMTQKWTQQETGAGTCRSVGFIMVAPDAGAYNVVVTASGSVTMIWGGAVGLDGLDQTTPTRTVYKVADKTVTVVDSVSGDLIIDTCGTYNSTIAVGAGQTSRVEEDAFGEGSISMGLSTESAVGANTVMSWTGGTYSAIGAMALIAAAAGGSIVPQAMMYYAKLRK